MEATLSATPRPRYAGLAIRTIAALVDCVVAMVAGWLFGTAVEATNLPIPALLLFLGGNAIGLTFAVAFPALLGWTPGKRIMGLRLINRAGNPGGIGWQAAILRWLAAYVSGIALGLGYLAIINDPEKRAWHDRFAGTHVLHD